jgi:hypothetical protein
VRCGLEIHWVHWLTLLHTVINLQVEKFFTTGVTKGFSRTLFQVASEIVVSLTYQDYIYILPSV